MRIVLSADDFGWDDDTIDATIECFQRGWLTGASLMPTMPGLERAAAFARENPQFSWGAHLTFAGDGPERALSAPSTIPTLARPDGTLRDSNPLRLRALTMQVPEAEIEREAVAQLELLRELGVPLSYVDSHGHQHKFLPFQRVLARVLPRFGLSRVRTSQDLFARPRLTSVTWWLGPLFAYGLRARFRNTRHFFMPDGAPDEQWVEPVLAQLDSLTGTLEIGVHPGRAEPWRANQLAGIEAIHNRLLQRGHTLIGWKDL